MAAVGFVAGAILGMALFGALIGWILRWVAPIRPYWSYAIGIAIMLPMAAWSYPHNHAGASLTEGLIIYGIGGLFAFPLLVATSLIGGEKQISTESRPQRKLMLVVKALGWVISALLFAVGLTLIFVAIKEQTSPAPPFFFGIISLMIGTALAWGLRHRRNERINEKV